MPSKWICAIAGLITLVSCEDQTAVLRKARKAGEMRETLIFACGYIYGQRAIIKAAGLAIEPPTPVEDCPTFRAVASENGFDLKNDDDSIVK